MLVLNLVFSCKGVQQSSKFQFNEGYYKVKTSNYTGMGYLLVDDDSVKVYPSKHSRFDSTGFLQMNFPEKASKPELDKALFIVKSFDLDVLTILFKYRPSVNNFPNQFTTHLNGAAYVGYRSDAFKIGYTKTPFYYKRKTDHFAYSFGGFLGMGATAMNRHQCFHIRRGAWLGSFVGPQSHILDLSGETLDGCNTWP